jgi:uncharacterized protein (TIGR00375 family)
LGIQQLKVTADLHIHGRYSRATSSQMSLGEIARFSKIKGLNLVGTGDFTHPEWLKEIRQTLTADADSGLLRIAGNPASPVRFMLTTEVCTIFDYGGESKKVHHVILAPSLEAVDQINERLKRFGDLASDGRPILNMTAPQFVEEVMAVSGESMVFPAHVWTPWFSLFGAFSGFDSVEDCYQDMTKHIYALETGLSSDPAMNWRLSKLDRFTLLSNSDCHSFWPWRIGREANVFDLEEFTYNQVLDAIKGNDAEHFKFTIETDPAYGKYHWTGHRNCKVSCSPAEALKFNNTCPVCRRKLTKGVEQRVEELADRPVEAKRQGAPGFFRLLPLSEIISTVLDTNSPSTQAVWGVYNLLVGKFADEYSVLIDASREALSAVVDPSIADVIVSVREGKLKVAPGYDGVYGQLVLDVPSALTVKAKPAVKRVQQLNMADFW